MRHLIAHDENYYVVGFCDRAFLGFESPDVDVSEGAIVELLPSLDTPKIDHSTPSFSKTMTVSDPSPNLSTGTNSMQKSHENVDSINDEEKQSKKQLNEICAVAIIIDTQDMVGESSDTIILRCAVARNNKSLDVYTVKTGKHLSKTSQLPSLTYRTPKRVNCFAFANIDAYNMESSVKHVKKPLLISGDVAGDSYAYNLLEKGERLLLGHTASMLTNIAILGGRENQSGEDCLLLTSDRDEKIRISRFPETHIIEGFILGHTAYITCFAIIPSPSPLIVSCGGDMTLRLWDLSAQKEICCASTSIATTGDATNSEKSNIPTAISVSSCGLLVAVIFDDSKRMSVYKITAKKNQDEGAEKKSFELLGSMDCPSQPLSAAFHEVQEVKSSENGDKTGILLTVLMADPHYIASYDFHHDNPDGVKPLALPQNENCVVRALRSVALKERICMPCTILEKDDYGNPVLQKENETRGPAANEAPWNRVERIEIAKEREKRRKKKPKLAEDTK